MLKENKDRYIHLENKIASLISLYFSTVDSKDDITINFNKLNYNGFEKESTIKYPKSGIDTDVRDLYKSGQSIVIKRSDLSDGTFKKKIVSIVFYMMLTKSYAFVGRFLSKQEGLVAAISPNGKLLDNHHLLSLASGKKTLPNSKSELNNIGQIVFSLLSSDWNIDQATGEEVFKEDLLPALSLFVSTSSAGYLPKAQRGGYNDLDYDELKRTFSRIFGFTGDVIIDLV